MSQQSQKPSKAPRWMKITLVLSLSLNLLVVGMVVGTAGRMVGHKGTPPRIADTGGAYTAALAPRDRRAIGQAMSEHYRSTNTARPNVREEYRTMIRVLQADPFDREAAQEVLDRQTEYADTRRTLSERVFLDRLEQMSQEERQKFVSRLVEVLQRESR